MPSGMDDSNRVIAKFSAEWMGPLGSNYEVWMHPSFDWLASNVIAANVSIKEKVLTVTVHFK